MIALRYECPKCRTEVTIAMGVFGDPVISRVMIVTSCSYCNQELAILHSTGELRPFVVSLDPSEMRGSPPDQLISIAVKLEEQMIPGAIVNGFDDEMVAGSVDNASTTASGNLAELNPSVDFGGDESTHTEYIACPMCGKQYGTVGEGCRSKYVRLPENLRCHECHHPMPQLWRRRGTTDHCDPMPPTSASVGQHEMPPITEVEFSAFVVKLDKIPSADDIKSL